MKSSKSSQGSAIELWLASLSAGLRLAALLMSESEREEAFEEYKAAFKMTPRKLAMRAVREHHPLEVLNDPDVALMHGVSENTYRKMRQQGELK